MSEMLPKIPRSKWPQYVDKPQLESGRLLAVADRRSIGGPLVREHQTPDAGAIARDRPLRTLGFLAIAASTGGPPAIAKLLNEQFVCIKVDREERPDVDEIYLTAVQAQGLSR